MSEQEIKVLRLIAKAVYDSVREFPSGAPSGLIFAALNVYGCTITQYKNLIQLMKTAKVLTQKGDLLFADGDFVL